MSNMSIEITHAETAATLATAAGIFDLYDANGQRLGTFTPAPRPGMSLPEFGVTDEELEREANDPNMKWHTPEQVMARLREIDQCSR